MKTRKNLIRNSKNLPLRKLNESKPMQKFEFQTLYKMKSPCIWRCKRQKEREKKRSTFDLILFWSGALRIVKIGDNLIGTWEIENQGKKDQNQGWNGS